MKKLIGAAILILLVYSCKKDAVKTSATSIYLHLILSHLRDSLSTSDFSQLDTTTGYLTDPGKTGNYTLRLPFKGKSITGDFVLLRTDANGNILLSRVVHLENDNQTGSQFSGNIRLSSLSGRVILESKVSNGSIESLHRNGLTATSPKAPGSKTTTVLPASGDADWLPEVVVVGYTSDSPPDSYISLDGLLDAASSNPLNFGGGDGSAAGGVNSGGGGGASGGSQNSSHTAVSSESAYYAPLDPSQLPGTSPFGRGITLTNALQFEQDYVNSIPTIDIRKFFNCFDQIPDVGASYSVQLCVDVPINNNPAASSNTSGFSAGHTFLVVTKSLGGMSITQSFGFYPSTTLSVWNPFSSRQSAIKDNGGQEINGSLTISISTAQFNSLKTTAINLASKSYVLDSSNCTDYALGVFNSARSSPIVLPPYVVREPGLIISGASASSGFTVTIANSPQQLYEKLSQMKTNADAEASNIQLNLSHNLKAPISHGPCD